MDTALYEKISKWMDDHEEALIRDISRMVAIPSVSDPSEPGGPFGAGCRKALEEMLEMGREYGFHTRNFENYAGSLWLEEGELKNTIGFWNHLDVVPVGDNWQYEPFAPVLKDGWLIGRGTQDNKGPAVGMLYLMMCLHELQIPLKHRLCLYVGCDEERGMEDMKYFTTHYETPALSLIADSGFPVCYGEKGIVEGSLISRKLVSGELLELKGGTASNMIPQAAYAVLCGKSAERLKRFMADSTESKKAGPDNAGPDNAEQDGAGQNSAVQDSAGPDSGGAMQHFKLEEREDGSAVLTAFGTSGHSAFPEGSCNAIQLLLETLLREGILEDADAEVIRPLAEANQDYYGEAFGIAAQDEPSGRLTSAGTMIRIREGSVELHFNIRYPIRHTYRELEGKLLQYCEEKGCRWNTQRNSDPNYFPREHPAVDLLTGVYNEIMGLHTEPFAMAGGTYARTLPHAFAYGIGGMPRTEEEEACTLFAPGHGGAHQPDEALYVKKLVKALKIYAMAIIALNELPELS